VLFRDVDLLGLIDPSGHEHHTEYDHQYSENDSADDVDRSPGRLLKSVKTKYSAKKAEYRQNAAEWTLHKITSNYRSIRSRLGKVPRQRSANNLALAVCFQTY